MAKHKYDVAISGKRKDGGSEFYVEVEADDSIFTSDVRGNNEAMKAIVMSQRPDVMTSHGPMIEIKVTGFDKKW